jgi:hypothetical protein
MSFFSRTACVFGVGLAVLVLSSACGQSTQACSPESEGYGDATGLIWTSLLETDRTEGSCKPRIELYSTGADLRRATDELKLEAPPFVDFGREKVILREAPSERGLIWMALRADKVTIGTQACSGNEPTGCHVHFYKVTTNGGTSVDEHTCPPLQCGGVQPDPNGGGA